MALFGNRQRRIYNRCKWWQEISHWPNGASEQDLAGCVDKAFGRTGAVAQMEKQGKGISDSGQPINKNSAGRWVYSGSNTEVPANDRSLFPCPDNCPSDDRKRPATNVFDEKGQAVTRLSRSVQYPAPGGEPGAMPDGNARKLIVFILVVAVIGYGLKNL